MIDEFLPEFDVVERHQTFIDAPVSRTYAALYSTDFGRSLLVRALLALRALPSLLLKAPGPDSSGSQRVQPLTLDTLLNKGFVLLSEHKEKEIVLGTVGRFWTPTGCLENTDAIRFEREDGAGVAKAAWNFVFEQAGKGTRVSTETRVKCADEASRRRFGAYWVVVGPFSGLIRRKMLKELKRSAERAV